MKVFVEEQKFTQLWLHILLIIIFIVTSALTVREYVASNTNNNDALVELIIVSASMLLVYLLIFSLKLKTRIDEKGINYQFSPFHFKEKAIPWGTIKGCYVRKYSPINEYGGWGYRAGLGRRNGKAYNIKGDIGIQIETKEGKRLLIGTQKEYEVNRVLQTYSIKISNHED